MRELGERIRYEQTEYEKSLTPAELEELTKRCEALIDHAEFVSEVFESLDLDEALIEAEIAEADARALKLRKDKWIKDRDIIHAENVASWRREQYERRLRWLQEKHDIDFEQDDDGDAIEKRLITYVAGEKDPGDDFLGDENVRSRRIKRNKKKRKGE